jgi:DNA-3-methyladenine glycosylase
VLLRALALPWEPERVASGPALLARRFGIDRGFDAMPALPEHGLWLAPRDPSLLSHLAGLHPLPVIQTGRIGISQAQDLPWRWYLRSSRSVSRRAPADRTPPPGQAWHPTPL